VLLILELTGVTNFSTACDVVQRQLFRMALDHPKQLVSDFDAMRQPP
jgi:hypothetical protein